LLHKFLTAIIIIHIYTTSPSSSPPFPLSLSQQAFYLPGCLHPAPRRTYTRGVHRCTVQRQTRCTHSGPPRDTMGRPAHCMCGRCGPSVIYLIVNKLLSLYLSLFLFLPPLPTFSHLFDCRKNSLSLSLSLRLSLSLYISLGGSPRHPPPAAAREVSVWRLRSTRPPTSHNPRWPHHQLFLAAMHASPQQFVPPALGLALKGRMRARVSGAKLLQTLSSWPLTVF